MTILTRIARNLSIRGLVLLSVGSTLLPLLLGMISAMVAFDRLATQSRQILVHLVGEAKISGELQHRLNDLERRSWGFLLSRDTASLGEFRKVHERFGQLLLDHSDPVIGENGRLAYQLEALARDEKNVFDSIVSRYPPHSGEGAVAETGPPLEPRQEISLTAIWFQSLKNRAEELSHDYALHVEEEARSLEDFARGVKRRLMLGFGLLLPISSLLVAVLVYLLYHPMRQIDHVIRALAAGNFTQPVRLVGTGDMVFLGERLEWLRTRLNDLELAKQRFVRNVSHEIKTPLATIHEGTDLLLDEVVGELNPEQKKIAQILVGNTDKLDRLIGQLINYSQVSARMQQQKLALVNMRRLVSGLVEDYQLQLRAKSIKVAESLDHLEIMGNVEQLRTIVDNLLSNAVKYSPFGGEIRLSLKNEGGHMVFEIEDDGPGVDPDERPRVFEPFFRGRTARDLDLKGSGFGLAIVAECVASHHGKVEILEARNGDAGALLRVQIPMPSSGSAKLITRDY